MAETTFLRRPSPQQQKSVLTDIVAALHTAMSAAIPLSLIPVAFGQ